MLGWQLIIDGTYPQKFDEEKVERMLKDIVKAAEMEIISGPLTVKGAEYNKGISSIAVIEYSTVSIHTFDDSMHIAIDLYSCKPYDSSKIKEIVKSYGVEIERSSILLRGREYEINPKEV